MNILVVQGIAVLPQISLVVPSVLALFAVMLILVVLAGRSRIGAGFRAADYAGKPLLTRWELAALGEMRHELPPSLHVCPQVRLADLVSIRLSDAAARQAALNRVASKSVDFVVIDTTGRVLLVVELDDRTHDRADRQQRDALVDAVLGQCGILLRRVRPRQPVGALKALTEAGLVAGLPYQPRPRSGPAPAALGAFNHRAARY